MLLWSLETENKTSRCHLYWFLYESLFSGSWGDGKILVKGTQMLPLVFGYQKFIVWIEENFQKSLSFTHCSLFILSYMVTLPLPCAMRKTYSLFYQRYESCSALCVRGKTCSLFCIRCNCCSALCVRGKTCSLFYIRYDSCSALCVKGKTCSLFCIGYDCCSALCVRGKMCSLFCIGYDCCFALCIRGRTCSLFFVRRWERHLLGFVSLLDVRCSFPM